MSDTPMDASKRTWLIASSCAGAIGAAFTAVPFVSSFQPSERAKAAGAPVEVDIAALKPGEKLTVEWRGKPVWIVKRTPEEIAALPKHDAELADPLSKRKPDELTPEYARNEARSIKPEVLVVVGICTHLGCSPEYVPEIKPEPFDPEWKGGFFCPCHKSRYDIAGRVFQGVPAPMNLVVPPYQFVSDKQILIGVGPGEKA
jgi:ubiquinol-cytochrome c reductase iron-sulfur subunit